MERIIPPAILKELGQIGVRDRNARIRKAAASANDHFARHPWAQALKGHMARQKPIGAICARARRADPLGLTARRDAAIFAR